MKKRLQRAPRFRGSSADCTLLILQDSLEALPFQIVKILRFYERRKSRSQHVQRKRINFINMQEDKIHRHSPDLCAVLLLSWIGILRKGSAHGLQPLDGVAHIGPDAAGPHLNLRVTLPATRNQILNYTAERRTASCSGLPEAFRRS